MIGSSQRLGVLVVYYSFFFCEEYRECKKASTVRFQGSRA